MYTSTVLYFPTFAWQFFAGPIYCGSHLFSINRAIGGVELFYIVNKNGVLNHNKRFLHKMCLHDLFYFIFIPVKFCKCKGQDRHAISHSGTSVGSHLTEQDRVDGWIDCRFKSNIKLVVIGCFIYGFIPQPYVPGVTGVEAKQTNSLTHLTD